MTTAVTLGMIMVYIAIMMGIGVYTSRKTKSVNDFVFPQLFLLDMLDNLVGIMELQPLGLALEMHYLAVRLPGWF